MEVITELSSDWWLVPESVFASLLRSEIPSTRIILEMGSVAQQQLFKSTSVNREVAPISTARDCVIKLAIPLPRARTLESYES